MNRSATILIQALGFAMVLGFLGYKIGHAKGSVEAEAACRQGGAK
jgi:hypothetical protein